MAELKPFFFFPAPPPEEESEEVAEHNRLRGKPINNIPSYYPPITQRENSATGAATDASETWGCPFFVPTFS